MYSVYFDIDNNSSLHMYVVHCQNKDYFTLLYMTALLAMIHAEAVDTSSTSGPSWVGVPVKYIRYVSIYKFS